MTKEMFNKVAKIQDIYNEVYTREFNASRGKSPIRIVEHENPMDDSSPVKKVYENEGNFFLCGYTWLWFSGKGNAGLKPALKKLGFDVSRHYYGGLEFCMNHMNLDGYGSNGDLVIREKAYEAVASYLCGLGFKVYAHSRLD